MSQTPVILASESPRRAELLDQIGVAFRVHAVDIDETREAAESPGSYVCRVALDKARAGWQQLGQAEACPVLAADTAVVVDDTVLGKPADRDDARRMLALLSGRGHSVFSAVALISRAGENCLLNVSHVTFRELSQPEIDDYWASGEPADKAGGYAIQGRAAVFVTHLQGSFSGVVGLPLFETAELLRGLGIGLPGSAEHDAA